MAPRGSISSSHTLPAILSESRLSAVDGTEKELSQNHFNSIDYGRNKYSVDNSVAHIDSQNSILGESSTIGIRGRESIAVPVEYPEAVTHREELPGDHPREKDLDRIVLGTEPRKIWGMKKKWAIVAMIAVGLIVAALVAGVAGGLHTRHSGVERTQQNLAAVNWTVGDVAYQAVFTQDPFDDSLIAYIKSDDSWTQVNISSCFDDSALPIRSQSPLAAIAMSDPADSSNPEVNQLRIYFATPRNSLVEIITHSANLTEWSWGILGPHTNHTLEIAGSSQLAATWRRCLNETTCGHGQFFVTYELDNALMVANSTANWDPSIAVDRIDSSSGITLISVQTLRPHTDNVSLNATDYAWAIYKDAGDVATGWQDFENDWSWMDKSKVINGMPPPQNSTLQT
ncbi:hypothetical protein HD806DRAFT_516053 [Xylariaceae sp. AK1471]|nr:hypothetical protein HD806DRAFT_516053 [Xylariaceae sp. AK1471]